MIKDSMGSTTASSARKNGQQEIVQNQKYAHQCVDTRHQQDNQSPDAKALLLITLTVVPVVSSDNISSAETINARGKRKLRKNPDGESGF